MKRTLVASIAASALMMPLLASALTQEEITQIIQFLQSLSTVPNSGGSSFQLPAGYLTGSATQIPAGGQLGLPSYSGGQLPQYNVPYTPATTSAQSPLPLSAFLPATSSDSEDPRVMLLRELIDELAKKLTGLLIARGVPTSTVESILASTKATSSVAAPSSGQSVEPFIPGALADGSQETGEPIPAKEFNMDCPALSYALQRGSSDVSTGGDVTALQTFLAKDPDVYPEGIISGTFGPLTEKAVQVWQEEHEIEQTGVVGPKTRASIVSMCETS